MQAIDVTVIKDRGKCLQERISSACVMSPFFSHWPSHHMCLRIATASAWSKRLQRKTPNGARFHARTGNAWWLRTFHHLHHQQTTSNSPSAIKEPWAVGRVSLIRAWLRLWVGCRSWTSRRKWQGNGFQTKRLVAIDCAALEALPLKSECDIT